MKGYAWILLVAFQLSVFLTAPRDLAFSSIPLIFGYVLAALALLIYTLRVDTLKNRCSEAFAMLFSKPEDGNGQNPVGRVTIESACGFALRTLFVVLVSAMSILLLTTLPITNSNRADLLRASVLNGNVLWPGATLCILAVAAYVVIREFAWRGMTSSQGRLYLRSVFMREHHTEFRSVVKQQQKLRRRAAVKAKKEKKRLRPT